MDVIKIKVENGAMLNVPIYHSHQRAKNWMAIINLDPKSPGGIARKFLEKGYGKDYYYLVDGLSVGQPVEFGADYYTGGGHKKPNRWYGVIIDMSDTEIVIEQAQDARKAIQRAAEIQPGKTPSPLEKYTTDEILTELKRRGIGIDGIKEWMDKQDRIEHANKHGRWVDMWEAENVE